MHEDITKLDDIPAKVQIMLQEGFLSNNRVEMIGYSLTNYLSDILDNKIQTLTLQVTQQCNLRCEYCIYFGSYTTRRHSNKVMDFLTAKKGIDFLISHSQNSKLLNLGFYGGELSLEFDLIKEFIKYIQEKAEGKKITYNITSNATLLNKDHIAFFAENDVALTISLDGPKDIHNKNRKFAVSWKGTFDVIVEKMKIVKEKFPEYYSRINFNCMLDPRSDISCVNEFWAKDELLKDSFVNANPELFTVIRFTVVSVAFGFETIYNPSISRQIG
ncbi:MAG: radical SAM protein [Lachnospiraceae bacterium]|nr:radical SAM protein [Lachnospiraceae bacterium]